MIMISTYRLIDYWNLDITSHYEKGPGHCSMSITSQCPYTSTFRMLGRSSVKDVLSSELLAFKQ